MDEQDQAPAPTHRVRTGRTLNQNGRILTGGALVALSPLQAADAGIREVAEPLPKAAPQDQPQGARPAVPATAPAAGRKQ